MIPIMLIPKSIIDLLQLDKMAIHNYQHNNNNEKHKQLFESSLHSDELQL